MTVTLIRAHGRGRGSILCIIADIAEDGLTVERIYGYSDQPTEEAATLWFDEQLKKINSFDAYSRNNLPLKREQGK